MSASLDYEVVYVSGDQKMDQGGADFDSDITEREAYAKLLKPDEWVSTRYCHFPQEVILKLSEKSSFRKVEIAPHWVHVPTKIEVFCGNPANSVRTSFWKADFEKLGTVRIKDASEGAKTLDCDAEGLFLKLLVHENIPDLRNNAFNQVGLRSVNVYGTGNGHNKPGSSSGSSSASSRPKRRTESRGSIGSRGGSGGSKSRARSPKVENSYFEWLRQELKILETEKRRAVRDDKFNRAKRCKEAIRKVEEAMEDVEKLEHQKRAAAEDEQFDKAAQLKKQIKELYDSTRAVCKRLLDRPDHGDNRSPSPVEHQRPRVHKIESDIVKVSLNDDSSDDDQRPSRRQRRPLTNERPSTDDNAFKRKENQVLPAVQKKRNSLPTEQPVDWAAEASNDNDVDFNDSSKLGPVARAFGKQVAANGVSKKWEDRRNAVEQTKRQMKQCGAATGREAIVQMLHAAVLLLQKTLRDKVYAVYNAAADLLLYCITDYTDDHRIAKTTAHYCPPRTTDILVTRTGDTINDSRFRKSVLHIVEELIRKCDTIVTRAYMQSFLQPFEASGYVKTDQGHAVIAELIVQQTDAPNVDLGVSEAEVCTFAMSCLMHTDKDVRQAGVRLIVRMYQVGDRSIVASYLPDPNSLVAQRNPLFKQLFSELDKIDKNDNKDRKNRSDDEITNYTNGMEGDTSSEDSNDSLTCDYCGLRNRRFSNVDEMRHHMQRVCSMITECEHCKQLVAIPSLKRHYLHECTVAKDQYTLCEKCEQPIHEQNYQQHNRLKRCVALKSSKTARCLLCLCDVRPNEVPSWRRHALKCRANARRNTDAIGDNTAANDSDQYIMMRR